MKKLEVVTPTPKHASRYVWVCDEDGAVAEMRNDARGLAYAKQFAAVPELLEALKACLNYMENTEGSFGITFDSADKARAAIAKAETL